MFAGPGAGHEKQQHPEGGLPGQLSQGHAAAVLRGKAHQGNLGKNGPVHQGQQSPQTGQHPPGTGTQQGEKQGGQQNGGHAAPAVEGVQQAHHRLLVPGGAGLHNGADKHLNEAAAHGVHRHRDEKPRQRGHPLGQHRQQHQPRRGKQVGGHHADPVADAVHKAGGQQVHRQLDQEIHRNEQGDLLQAQAVLPPQGEKQQGHKGVDHRLDHVAPEAGPDGGVVVSSHDPAPPWGR